MDGKGNRLINIFGPNETPEQKQQKEAERKRLHDERVKREGEVKALFDEYDKIYEKQRYIARVPELLKYLKTKKHAITFWSNPHVKMIYNISDHRNFLLSIYAEETDNRKYEEWLRKYFSNPFFNHTTVNPEMLKTIANTDSKDYYKILYGNIYDLCEKQNEFRRYIILESEDKFIEDSSRIMIKSMPGKTLLDLEPYDHLVNTYSDLPIYYEDASRNLREARERIITIEETLTEIARHARNSEDFEIPQSMLNEFKNRFRDLINNLELIALCIGGKNQDLPSIRQNLNEIREKVDTLNKLLELRNVQQTLLALLQEFTEHYRSELAKYMQNVYSYNPLILMNNNFLRLDTYNDWKNKFKKYWKEVTQRDPVMFQILDALVKSRKIYLKEINK